MTLFLILWFADFCDSFSAITTGLIIVMLALAIMAIVWVAIDLDSYGGDVDDLVRYKKLINKKLIKIFGITLIVMISISLLLPSSRTIYIATGINAITETTKTVANSETAKKAIELLNIKLDESLENAKK